MKIAICGITGAVGKEILHCLHELELPVSKLSCFASHRSAGQSMETPFGRHRIECFSPESCKDFDIVFLCVSGSFSGQYGKILANQNRYVIDNSSHFRYDQKIPLIIPEINIENCRGHRLISNPNCTTAILAVALYPIYRTYGLKRVIVSTYQACSGGGQAAMDELRDQTENYLKSGRVTHEKFAHPIPFNLIPAIDSFQENDYTREEMKVVWETRKIFDDEDILISATAVRVPTFRAHAESVTIETQSPVRAEDVRRLLANAPGVRVKDVPSNQLYPMPLTATGKADVEVGRIRNNPVFGNCGLDFFICGDQLLKGAALNAVQIALQLPSVDHFIPE